MKLFYRYLAVLVVVTAVWQAQGGDEIQVYTVPKDHPAIAGAATTPDLPVNSSPIHWTTPQGWEELPATSFRLINLSITGQNGGKAEVAVTSFPGEVGTELENVNRWRRELKLEPVDESGVASQPVTVDGNGGKLYDISGKGEKTVVAMIPRNGATWFFKLHGDEATVAGAQGAFNEFLRSVRFSADAAVAGDGGQGVATLHPPADVTSGTDPHAGLNTAADTGSESGGDTPKWNVPPNWTEKEPGPMIFKRFAAAHGDAKAVITISFFPGDVGGVLANVNRWRGQLGLAPVSQEDLGNVTQNLNGATLVDFKGSSQAGEPAQMVAVIMPHGDNTWFYKLLGDPAAVAQEKDAFVNFVKSVHYP